MKTAIHTGLAIASGTLMLAGLASEVMAQIGDGSDEAPTVKVVDHGSQPHSLDMPSYQAPPDKWRDLEDATGPTPEQCADRVRQVREESGQPELDENPAKPEQAPLIWAVDKRLDNGCSVMVMKGDVDDIRPVPESNGKGELIPVDQ